MRSFWSVAVLAIVSSCQKPSLPPQNVSGALIVGPTTVATDATFLNTIDKADPSGALWLMDALKGFDPVSDPEPKSEFETTADYDKRLKNNDLKKRTYGHQCYAHLEDIDFQYDADKNIARFGASNLIIDMQHPEGPAPFTTHRIDNILFDDGKGMGDGLPLVAKIPIEKAKAWSHGLEGGKLRVARIFTFSGRKQPVVSWGYDGARIVSEATAVLSDGWEEASKRFHQANFTIQASLLSVEVFDPRYGGIKHPLFYWKAKSSRC